MFKTLEEQISNRCSHFNGIGKNVCEAGVNYEAAFNGGTPGMMQRMACFKHASTPMPCALVAFPSADDVAKEIAHINERSDKLRTAMIACRADADSHGWGKDKGGGASSIPCPVCNSGTLRYSIANVNGHMHGRCSTAGCMSWMQ